MKKKIDNLGARSRERGARGKRKGNQQLIIDKVCIIIILK